MMRGFFILGGILLSLYLWMGREIARPDGVLIPEEPVQRELPRLYHREKNGYRVAFLASFDVRARVIATERYWFDRGAALAPVDFALGWGPMSNGAVLKALTISQGGRFYRWWAATLPIPRQAIETHSANMHMIPASDGVERQLKSLRAGHLVRIKGYLVDVTGANGFRWTSSLTRKDTGAGACELVWVESVESW